MPDASTTADRLARVRRLLSRHGLDGWYFGSFHEPDPVLDSLFPESSRGHATRRCAYFIPAAGEPIRVTHAVEPERLGALPGAAWRYDDAGQWERATRALLDGASRVAVQYSPRGAFPAADRLPAGWLEALRAAGAEPVSSAPLLPELAALEPHELAAHERAASALTAVVGRALGDAGEALARGGPLTEVDLRERIARELAAAGLETPDAPIVAFGEHTADPHHEAGGASLRRGDLVLVDVWARPVRPPAVFADISWMAVADEEIPHEYEQLFATLAKARDQAVTFVVRTAGEGKPVRGADVDELVRGVLEGAGYLDYVLHRTGHSLGRAVHDLGVNLDAVETRDDRPIAPGSAFTVEPGLYLPGRYGMRTEVDMVLLEDGARVTTVPFQDAIKPLIP